jgi:hypothetical protein
VPHRTVQKFANIYDLHGYGTGLEAVTNSQSEQNVECEDGVTVRQWLKKQIVSCSTSKILIKNW